MLHMLILCYKFAYARYRIEMTIYELTSQDIRRNIEELHQIVFEVTDKCNLRCDYCLYSGIYNGFSVRYSDDMSVETADSIVDYLFNIWRKCDDRPHRPVFVGFYGGEPLMNMPLIKHIIERFESEGFKNREFIFTMTTNAVLLDRYEDYIAGKNISLLISLDGPGKMDSHRHFENGLESFPLVERNIKSLRYHHPAYFRRKVGFNSVISSTTDLKDLQNYFLENFGKSTKISEINGSNVSECGKPLFESMHCAKGMLFKGTSLEIDEEGFWMEHPKAKMAIDYITHFSGNSFDSYNALLGSGMDHPRIPSGTCAPFYKKMFVTVQGKILQCEKISHDFYLGRVEEGKVEMDLDKIACQFNGWMSQIGVQCRQCSVSKACPQCVFQLDSMLKEKLVCNHMYDSVKFAQYSRMGLEAIRSQPELYRKIIEDVTIH